jgi:CDP-diacylglycerol--glycerol-3-phosphate 3-phosphatidyltransferase
MSESISAVLRLLTIAVGRPEGVVRLGVVAATLWTMQVGYLVVTHRATRVAEGGLSSIGVANGVTMLRGGLYAVVAGFVLVPPDTPLAWVPAICYGSGVVLDNLDGSIARTIGRETDLGKRLDMAFDTFGFVVAPLVAVVWGVLPVWYLSLSAARFVYRGGLGWRTSRGRPVFDPPEGQLSRYLAGMQMGFLTAALAPPMPASLIAALAPFTLAPSLAVFARDFLYASGRLPRNGRAERN